MDFCLWHDAGIEPRDFACTRQALYHKPFPAKNTWALIFIKLENIIKALNDVHILSLVQSLD